MLDVFAIKKYLTNSSHNPFTQRWDLCHKLHEHLTQIGNCHIGSSNEHISSMWHYHKAQNEFEIMKKFQADNQIGTSMHQTSQHSLANKFYVHGEASFWATPLYVIEEFLLLSIVLWGVFSPYKFLFSV